MTLHFAKPRYVGAFASDDLWLLSTKTPFDQSFYLLEH